MQFVDFILKQLVFVTFECVTLLFLYLYLIDSLSFFQSHWKGCLLYIILFAALSYLTTFYQDTHYVVLYFAYSVLYLAYITKTSIQSSLLVTVLSFLIYAITELATFIPVSYLMGLSIDVVRQDISQMRKVLLIVRPFQIVIIYLITRLPIKREVLKKKSSWEDRLYINYLLLILFFMTVFFTGLAKHVQNTSVLITSALIFLLVVVLSVMEVKERIKLIEIKGQLKLQKEYARNMELIVDAVRKEKHDYKNHISTLVALCTMQDQEIMDKVRSYAQKLINIEFEGGFHFYNTGNKYLDGLLAMKKNTATERDIYFDVDVESTLENIHVDDVDLTTIVGNIVDNAFDAVISNPPDKKKIVSLSLYEEDDKLHISISNNGSEINEQHKKHIFEYKYSTKNKVAGERGYGLYIVKELTEKNHGDICFHSNDLETEFLISFKRMKERKVEKEANGVYM